jgi:hypothetical protein
MQALRHEDAAVRETAADCLVWEQPNEAAGDLLRLAGDARYENVAIGAMNTLNYYATQEVLLRFNELLLDGPVELRENYQAGADYVKEDFIMGCKWAMTENADVRRYLFTWLRPVMHLFKAEDFHAPKRIPSSNGRQHKRRPEPLITVDEMMDDLSDADGRWGDKLKKYLGYDWSRFTNDEAIRLVRYLALHDDMNVREIACSVAGYAKLSDLLFELMHDPTNRVTKSAAYNSRMLVNEGRFADRLWDVLINPQTQGCFATETLESYLVHADEEILNARLEKLALDDERPSVKAAAFKRWSHLTTTRRPAQASNTFRCTHQLLNTGS